MLLQIYGDVIIFHIDMILNSLSLSAIETCLVVLSLSVSTAKDVLSKWTSSRNSDVMKCCFIFSIWLWNDFCNSCRWHL